MRVASYVCNSVGVTFLLCYTVCCCSTHHFTSHCADKYTQVSRILSPIVQTIRHIDKMTTNAKMSEYLASTFGGPEKLKKDILFDFFRYAFDGSGADNFFDAG